MKIAVVSHDAGSSELLCALIGAHQDEAQWHIFALAESPMGRICTAMRLPFSSIGDAANQLQSLRPDLLLFGTGWQNPVERPFVSYAKEHRIPAVAFIDHWSNYRERFGYPTEGWEENLGDFTALHDPKALELARTLGLPRPIPLPNYYLQNLIADAARSPVASGESLLFLSEPTDAVARTTYGDPLYWGFTQFTALSDILEHFGRFGCDSLTIRLHPSETEHLYSPLIQDYPDIDIRVNDARSVDLIGQLQNAKMVIGFDSMALYIAALLEKPVLSYLPSPNRKFLLPLPPERQLRTLDLLSPKLLEPIWIPLDEFGMDFATFLQTVAQEKRQ